MSRISQETARELLESAREMDLFFEHIKFDQHEALIHNKSFDEACNNWNDATMGISFDMTRIKSAITKAEAEMSGQ